MDIAVWLRSLGLGQYEAAFRENEINERVLPSLTAEDLKEIGVGPVGHRRMLLEAIAALRNDTSKVPSVGAATTSGAPYRTIDPSLLSRCYLCRRWTRLNTEIPRAVELEELVEPIRRRYRVGPVSSCSRRGI